ncbi:Hypothetical predicted protein [Drosophila guanche]|uniref:Uncharacterized protein n=1 Tax=Drosophila guanche TaxID=7266 RepID=A0A3B0JSM7_DROGU|nr:Hypothetical predicted protein [Drosophila guanche]
MGAGPSPPAATPAAGTAVSLDNMPPYPGHPSHHGHPAHPGNYGANERALYDYLDMKSGEQATFLL